MANYKKEENSGKVKERSSNGAAGYEYTPGDGSAAEKRDQMRGVQKGYSGSKLDSGATRTTPVRSSGSGGGASRNTSPTVSNAANAVDIATGITKGYTPTGTYNDAKMRARSDGTIDPITQYKLQYEAAKARGDQAGMDQAHNLAEQYRSQFGYSGGLDGSESIGVTPTVSAAANALATTASAAQQANMAAHGYNYKPGMDIKLSGNIAAGDPIFGSAGVDANGYFDSSTAFYKTLPNGWRIPNTYSNGSLQPGDKFYMDTTQGSAWSQDAVKANPALKNAANAAVNAFGAASTGGESSGNALTAVSGDGRSYTIGSQRGLDFVNSAAVGATMTGGDGSTWVKNPDGSVSIIKNGTTYTVSGTVPTQNTSGQQAQQQAQPFQMPEAFAYTPFEESELGKLALQGYQGHLKELENYPDFSYDPLKDPLYQQYADAYTRGGQRAMQDTMGQIAARTGGLASSYAGQVGQQTYDQYMADLANKIPELRQIAYNMYSDDYNRQLGLYDRGYDRYSDDYNRYIDQARFGYQRYGDDRDLAYQLWRAQVGDQQWQTQFDWTKSTDARDYARNVFTSDRAYDRDVLTSDRDYEANRADTKWSQDWQQTQFDYQKEQDAWNRQLAERQYQDSLKAELRDRVDRYGYMPTQQDAETYGLTAAELASLQEQARHVRAADASKYYSGW